MHTQQSAEQPWSPPRTRRRRREPLIAVVDDDTAFLRMMNVLLLQEGYQTLLWLHGAGAYEMIRREQPDLVILDLRMDGSRAGWQTLEQIWQDPRTAGIPVIICSADASFLRDQADRLQGRRCRLLEKPFDLEDLLAKVQAFVGPPASAADVPGSDPGGGAVRALG